MLYATSQTIHTPEGIFRLVAIDFSARNSSEGYPAAVIYCIEGTGETHQIHDEWMLTTKYAIYKSYIVAVARELEKIKLYQQLGYKTIGCLVLSVEVEEFGNTHPSRFLHIATMAKKYRFLLEQPQ